MVQGGTERKGAYTKDESTGTEKVSQLASPNGVSGRGLEVDLETTRDVLLALSLGEEDVEAVSLNVGRTGSDHAVVVETVLLEDGLPESGGDLVTGLTCMHA